MNIIISIFELLLLGLGIFLLIKILTAPIRLIFKVLLNAVLGWVFLFVFNLIFSNFGFSIGVSFLTALVAGIFGVPGVVVLAVLTFLSII